MKHFPRFIYSNPKNPDALGPVLFHLNYPRCAFYIVEGKIESTTYIDRSASDSKREELQKEAEEWLNKNKELINE